VSLGEV
jgi:hypothetical protein